VHCFSKYASLNVCCQNNHKNIAYQRCKTMENVGHWDEGGKIKKNEMGRACGAYGGGERCAHGFGGEA
jgi:hypothetical protein